MGPGSLTGAVSTKSDSLPDADFEGEKTPITLEYVPIDNSTAKLDLALEMMESPAGLIGCFEYSTDLFDAATIERMTGHFAQLLEGIIVNPHARIGDLPLLGEKERQQLLVEWNATRQHIVMI